MNNAFSRATDGDGGGYIVGRDQFSGYSLDGFTDMQERVGLCQLCVLVDGACCQMSQNRSFVTFSAILHKMLNP